MTQTFRWVRVHRGLHEFRRITKKGIKDINRGLPATAGRLRI